MKDSAKPALAQRDCATREEDHQQEGNLTTCCQVDNYVLATWAIDEVIAEGEADTTTWKRMEGMCTVSYWEVLYEKALQCGVVDNESLLKEVFIRRLQESIR